MEGRDCSSDKAFFFFYFTMARWSFFSPMVWLHSACIYCFWIVTRLNLFIAYAHCLMLSFWMQDEVFRKLALRVAPSVVVVEDKKNSCFFPGCVIHKTDSDTFVLTQEITDKESDLVVHFSDNSAKPAKSIATGPWFDVLAVGEEHKTCKSVSWTDPVIDSHVLILVPKSTSSYQKIIGFTSGSCEAAAGDDPPVSVIDRSRDLFITSCHHGKTEMMVSTPVFNKSGKGTGVVVSDCEQKSDGVPQKICLSNAGLMDYLQIITKEENWKVFGLSNKFVYYHRCFLNLTC